MTEGEIFPFVTLFSTVLNNYVTFIGGEFQYSCLNVFAVLSAADLLFMFVQLTNSRQNMEALYEV